MYEFDLTEIIEIVVDVWKALINYILIFILLFTTPLWIIPYGIYNKLNYGYWF